MFGHSAKGLYRNNLQNMLPVLDTASTVACSETTVLAWFTSYQLSLQQKGPLAKSATYSSRS